MKYISLTLLVLVILGMYFVVADNSNDQGHTGQNPNLISFQGSDEDSEEPVLISPGKHYYNGDEVDVSENGSKKRIRVQNISADCECNLTQERVQNKTTWKMSLSNGRNAEIKVMPNTASETALARLRLKVCSPERNCTIVLKEVGSSNETKATYELDTDRESKVFGFAKKKMKVVAFVDAETGEIIKVKKPWWAFLAKESEE